MRGMENGGEEFSAEAGIQKQQPERFGLRR